MARGKKKESALTPEEKLAQALVPDWEQPYKVPENWCWTQLRHVVLHTSGNSKLIKGKLQSEHCEGLFPAFSASGQDVFYENFEHEGNAIIVSAVGARCGKAFLAQGKWSAIANTHCVFPNENVIDLKFLYYLINDEEWWIKSGSAQPFVSVKASFERPFGLPPIVEQRRIVDRIEYLFAKLDEAKEKAQSVLDSFETRKAAILHKAFTGELTAKWREERGVGMDSWNNTSLAQVVSGFKYGTSEKSDYNNTGMPVLRIPNIGDGCVDFSDIKYLNHSDIDEESQIHEGDILIIRSNGSRDLVGKSVLVPKLDRPHAYASFLIRIKPSAIVKADYLTSYLNSADARSQMFRKAKSSAGINNINSKELGAISLMLPSISEQMEIVRILDTLLAKEQQAKEAAEAVLEKIDLLKKSILARAFRGELGTNDPSEESALELLKSIL